MRQILHVGTSPVPNTHEGLQWSSLFLELGVALGLSPRKAGTYH